MGTNSKYERFHEAGEETNVNNVGRFGQPVRSLFTTSKVFTLHHHIDIEDRNENIVYQSNTKAISIHDRTTITDASGAKVADIEKKLMTFHERHIVTMADGFKFQISNEFFHIVKDIYNIEGLGWQMRGNIIGLNFEVYDGNDNIIAVIGQKFLSIHDKYSIDIYKAEDEEKIVALVIALQHMIIDREIAAGAAATAAGGSSMDADDDF